MKLLSILMVLFPIWAMAQSTPSSPRSNYEECAFDQSEVRSSERGITARKERVNECLERNLGYELRRRLGRYLDVISAFDSYHSSENPNFPLFFNLARGRCWLKIDWVQTDLGSDYHFQFTWRSHYYAKNRELVEENIDLSFGTEHSDGPNSSALPNHALIDVLQYRSEGTTYLPILARHSRVSCFDRYDDDKKSKDGSKILR